METRVYGVQQTIRELKAVEPTAVNELRKDLRNTLKPLNATIQAGIPTQLMGMRGMKHNGRTAYNPNGIKAVAKTDFSKRSERGGYALVSIWVGPKTGDSNGAGFQIADMAGRAGKTKTGMSREYTKNGRTAQHRLNGQGKQLITQMTSYYGRASRFVWRRVEAQIPTIQREILVTLEKVSERVNANLVVK
jgi:hypothetical protein